MERRVERGCHSTRDAMEVDINMYTDATVLFDVIEDVLLHKSGVQTGLLLLARGSVRICKSI